MTYKFSAKSLERLSGVHPKLVQVMEEAIKSSPLDFSIAQGLRTLEQQKALFESGKSKTMRSRHLTGHAVDIAVFVDGTITWELNKYRVVTDHIKTVAKRLGIPIECGIDWTSFIDGPHIQLPWSSYP
jgi:peptidoglycan L-alanyl-D-glutamate endopeptidase CwlK